jgi:membrane protein DedA with SNARE-associated domain
MLTYAGIQLGNNWENIDKYSIYLDIAAVFAIVVFIIWIISKRRSLRKSD